ncbi:MAG: ABC transporter ATP-binding protein [Armatimonadetes bacterium]|nr:ABC transporter ATP-binding protein [Armatimonadota bacterium]
MAVIRVENLARRFGQRLAVAGVSFEVEEGEIFGFLGPNGAGKTTTQRMLTGVLEPTSGHAFVLDHDMARDPIGAKEHVGVVPEVSNPYVELTAWQNAMLMAELYGLSRRRRQERGEELFEFFELTQRRHDKVKTFSKGMRQRLMLIMALMHEPQALFLDEPTAGLDVASRRLIHTRVRQLAAEGAAVFYTTHNIEEANALCNRVAIIRQGKLVAVDTPENLKAAFAGSQSVQVAFAGPVAAEEVFALPGVERGEVEGDKLRLYTQNPGAVIEQVVGFAAEHGLKILSLNTLGPSLEEVFVRLTEGASEVEAQ